jgi:hypothetical protein
MDTSLLKSNLHALINDSENADLLESVYEMLSNNARTNEGDMWTRLSTEQKAEVLLAYEESEDPSKLISHERVLRELK